MKKFLGILVLGFLIVSGVDIAAKEKGNFKGTIFLDGVSDSIDVKGTQFNTFAGHGLLVLHESNNPLFKVGAQNSFEVDLLTSFYTNKKTKGGSTFKDADGDKLYVVFKHYEFLNKTTALGRNILNGGTGKYKGLKAKCEYTQKVKSMALSVVDLECDWKK